MTLHAFPNPERAGAFYQAVRAMQRLDDALRLIREAEQIAKAHAAKVDERAAKARWARRMP